MSKGSAQMITRLRAALMGRGETISAQILQGASSTAVLSVANTGLTFVTTVLLARFLGVDEYGIFAYAMSWVTLLGVVAGLGLNEVIVAEVAVYHQKHDWAHIRGMLRFTLIAVATAGVVCALAMAGIGWLMHRNEPAFLATLLVACLLLPLRAVLLPFGAIQSGLRRVTFAQLPTLLVIPASFLAIFVVAFALGLLELSASSAIMLQVIAVIGGLIVAVLLLRKGLAAAERPRSVAKPLYEPRTWLLAGLPMILMGSMFLVNSNADILMLGALVGAEEAGVYKAAARGAELLTYALVIVSAPLGPVVARLYAAGKMEKLQRELVCWARIAFVPTLALSALFLFEGEWFLALFGPGFVNDQSRASLAILTVGQLVHAGAGPVGLLLIMTGHRSATAWVLTAAATVNLGLNVVLIPVWGASGAAVATASSTALFALLLVRYAGQQIHLNTTVMPAFLPARP